MIENRGDTLIIVPCWWDGSTERYYSCLLHAIMLLHSLLATIKKERPDLLQEYNIKADPIPEEPPPDFFSSILIITCNISLISCS